MIYFEEVLGRVFADSSTKSTIVNNDILVSCKDDLLNGSVLKKVENTLP